MLSANVGIVATAAFAGSYIRVILAHDGAHDDTFIIHTFNPFLCIADIG
jgi:hypothetical protein